MINANLEQFLDTGWYNNATLYLNGYTYCCEGLWNKDRKQMHFIVYKYKSEIVDKIYTKPINPEKYIIELESYGDNEDIVKENFLKAKIFDGKAFWDVEKEIAWYEEI